MTRKLLSLCTAILVLAACGGQKTGIIKTEVPARPAGQQDMIQFAAEPIANVGIGVVGLGMRGSDAVERLSFVPGCHVAAVCDLLTGRADSSLKYLNDKGIQADMYAGEEESYKALCEDPDVDLVYICTDWIHHVPVALYAMEHGEIVDNSIDEFSMGFGKRIDINIEDKTVHNFGDVTMGSAAN